MTVMVSFRADDEDVAAADRWAAVLGVERSELLRQALANHLARLSVEEEAARYDETPITDDEQALDGADDWGPTEDWSDWHEWAAGADRATG